MTNVTRPAAPNKKISSKDEFELCYLRHQYFRKANRNPSKEEMAPYLAIIRNVSYRNYSIYQGLFDLIGMNAEDIMSICHAHLVSFLELFEITKDVKKYQSYIRQFNKKHVNPPTDADILDKNKAIFTMFLKQRMQDLIRICHQKGNNIKGLLTEMFFNFMGIIAPPEHHHLLLNTPEIYGFKKISTAIMRKAKKLAKVDKDCQEFELNGSWYVAVKSWNKGLSMEHFIGADMSPYDNEINMTPERLMIEKENASFWDRKKVEFKRMDKVKRNKIVQAFVDKNRDNPKFIKEIKYAERLLRTRA